MGTIPQLDAHTAEIARGLLNASKPADWSRVSVTTWFTPDGSTSVQSFRLEVDAGPVEGWSLPIEGTERDKVFGLFLKCWRFCHSAGNPWYGMTVELHRSGRFSVDFEYRDHYQEGDIMREGR